MSVLHEMRIEELEKEMEAMRKLLDGAERLLEIECKCEYMKEVDGPVPCLICQWLEAYARTKGGAMSEAKLEKDQPFEDWWSREQKPMSWGSPEFKCVAKVWAKAAWDDCQKENAELKSTNSYLVKNMSAVGVGNEVLVKENAELKARLDNALVGLKRVESKSEEHGLMLPLTLVRQCLKKDKELQGKKG